MGRSLKKRIQSAKQTVKTTVTMGPLNAALEKTGTGKKVVDFERRTAKTFGPAALTISGTVAQETVAPGSPPIAPAVGRLYMQRRGGVGAHMNPVPAGPQPEAEPVEYDYTDAAGDARQRGPKPNAPVRPNGEGAFSRAAQGVERGLAWAWGKMRDAVGSLKPSASSYGRATQYRQDKANPPSKYRRR